MSEPTKADPEVAAMAAAVRPSRLVPALIGMNSLMLVGVMAFLVMQSMKAPAAPAEHAPAAEHEAAEEPKAEPEAEPEKGKDGKPVKGLGPLVKIADFVIHLRNPEIDRYARLSFDVEVISDADREQLNAHMPRVRDAFISYLSDRTLEELQGTEGLGRTKEALAGRIRELVPEARVRSLYISDFVVQ
ncbi:MAG: flagellar basal body-associated FliL family protein [Myxococcales bacterium]|nr:flagellar basal body-associated FliL family protein [Myxococcales bacterium]